MKEKKGLFAIVSLTIFVAFLNLLIVKMIKLILQKFLKKFEFE
jgi:hypothetical protein